MIRNFARPCCRGVIFALLAFHSAFTRYVHASVTRIVIDEKQSPTYDGKSFGGIGPYEKLTGHVFGELDPKDPRNQIINDIDLAPKNQSGKVQYEATFTLLKPVDV